MPKIKAFGEKNLSLGLIFYGFIVFNALRNKACFCNLGKILHD